MNPGTTGAISTPTFTPASRSWRTARSRCSGCAVPGSSADHAVSSTVGTLRYTVAPARLHMSARMSAVADDHRAFRHQTDRRAAVVQRFERSSRQLVVSFDRLIRIGRGPDRHLLALPGVVIELLPQDFDQVGLDEDDRRELVARSELELRLVAPGEAVVTGVGAAAIGIQRPVEGHPLHAVERRAAGDLLIAGSVGPQLRLVERR